jgi:hypothetical protein
MAAEAATEAAVTAAAAAASGGEEDLLSTASRHATDPFFQHLVSPFTAQAGLFEPNPSPSFAAVALNQHLKEMAMLRAGEAEAARVKAAMEGNEERIVRQREMDQKLAKAHAAAEAAGAHECEWVEAFDPAEGQFYYYSRNTGEYVWEKPENYVMAGDDEEMRAVIKIQCCWRARAARRQVRAQEALKKTNFEVDAAFNKAKRDQHLHQRHEWVECYDPEHEAFYYFNNFTKEHTWDKPESYLMAADDAEMRAVIVIQCSWRAKISRRRVGGKALARKDAEHAAKTKEEEAANAKLKAAKESGLAAAVACAAVTAAKQILVDTVAECKALLKQKRDVSRAKVNAERAKRSKERRRGYLLLDTKARRELVQSKVSHYTAEHDQNQTWEWVEALDNASQKYYYYNHYSKELYAPDPWIKPDGYVMAFEDGELRAALVIQGLFRAVPRPHEAAASTIAIEVAEKEAAGFEQMAAAL